MIYILSYYFCILTVVVGAYNPMQKVGNWPATTSFQLHKIVTMEIWKDIPSHEGSYQASTLGNIRSLDRKVWISANKQHPNGTWRSVKGRVLKAAVSKRGYRVVVLYHNKMFTCSKLVAMTFLGHTPCGYQEVVDHINNNPLDDRLENLQLITHRENISKDRANCSSKYTGVYWHKPRNRWRATIQIDGQSIYLGAFVNEIDAHYAYQNALNNL